MVNKQEKRKLPVWAKILLVILILFISFFVGLYVFIFSMMLEMHVVFTWINPFVLPAILIPLVLCNNREKVLKIEGIVLAVYLAALFINVGVHAYNESLTIDTSPNIDVNQYMPFDENSKIVTLDKEASL